MVISVAYTVMCYFAFFLRGPILHKSPRLSKKTTDILKLKALTKGSLFKALLPLMSICTVNQTKLHRQAVYRE